MRLVLTPCMLRGTRPVPEKGAAATTYMRWSEVVTALRLTEGGRRLLAGARAGDYLLELTGAKFGVVGALPTSDFAEIFRQNPTLESRLVRVWRVDLLESDCRIVEDA